MCARTEAVKCQPMELPWVGRPDGKPMHHKHRAWGVPCKVENPRYRLRCATPRLQDLPAVPNRCDLPATSDPSCVLPPIPLCSRSTSSLWVPHTARVWMTVVTWHPFFIPCVNCHFRHVAGRNFIVPSHCQVKLRNIDQTNHKMSILCRTSFEHIGISTKCRV
jgi:hypothetical protein